MVYQNASRLDRVFRALADPTRRAMLRRLAEGDSTIGDLAEPFEMSLPGASKHIRVLEEAGLVRREVLGRTHRCSLVPGPLSEADRWLRFYERFWTDRLDSLERELAGNPEK